MEDTNIQWHPAFVAAMNLEFSDNRENLIFEKEHNLNTKPLAIDLLIIKKESNIPIKNEIGHIFKGHNIIEFKSPVDQLDIDVFYKSIAYACLYKSYGITLDERKADDITVSIVRDSKPRELLKYLNTHGFSIFIPHKGIYYVTRNVLFPTQIIVTKELDEKNHTWLRALSQNVKATDARRLLSSLLHLKGNFDKEMADSVLKVMLDANRQILEEWKGDHSMYEYLMEIVEPQIRLREENEHKKGVQQGIHQGIHQGILTTIDSLRDFGHNDSDIRTTIMRRYHLSSKEADKYFPEFKSPL